MKIFSVIMAGGGGTRFWPLSRQHKPKQLINLGGHDVMVNETIRRNASLIPEENTYIVTNKLQGDILKEVVLDSVKEENILLEPVGRNTAACIGLAATFIHKRHGDSVMCIFPSDAYIGNLDEYTNALKLASDYARNTGSLVIFGIKPSYPATGYGYIKYHITSTPFEGIHPVDEFIEKPDHTKALKYVSSGNFLWNSGILVGRTSVILENFSRFLPKLRKQLSMLEAHIDTVNEDAMLEEIYPLMQSISVDYGILERSDNVVVVPGDFGWSDVGSWDTLNAVFPADESGNIIKAQHIGIDTKNTLVYGNKLITTLGIQDMIIVSTDDALLICPKDRAQDVKNIVALLKEKGLEQYL